MNKFFEFLKDVRIELKKVSWPSQQETIKLTGVVILMSVALAAFLGLLDFGFLTLLNKLLF
ncbi:MAG: preprotein translocase subunit SecE [Parcubacteria group bacterium RIFCSPHIGHO2_01_FULL_40_30]|nr:MAG: preprotein translocase subunit SecE [Parcubacteria group bacterium RIFCSPHIGHO2_01_FULL_40_30]OHB19630.1 MAG: preprotein translocase subunit SecE [Parcubacteria group bacterium RIFCSPHIGHO2_02_FULL_40_12]OHB23634.1 MAG: preprotein translocase subunit SecE [Parcubacteria group bacterium RIFCSPLOWO2_02_FULL_40_12]OHB24256.1 MAG: preprotein translocase subunit SecE [Parcubacteria group bacterium RIFCSPLOWO2_12_FULL_40_10]